MSQNSLTVLRGDIPLYLDPKETKALETWEEWISYYTDLNAASNSVSWIKADFFMQLYQTWGEGSLENFASDVGEPRSTVTNYVRTAKAFPPEKRIPSLSFTHHYQASFADPYDESKGNFTSEKRFELIEKAEVERLSTRDVQDEARESKEEVREQGTPPECYYCGKASKDVVRYVFFAPRTGQESIKFELHPDCFEDIVNYIEKKHEQ